MYTNIVIVNVYISLFFVHMDTIIVIVYMYHIKSNIYANCTQTPYWVELKPSGSSGINAANPQYYSLG
ncbi:hypothetical protein Bca101_017496 [Brassica carinata]